MDRPGHRARAAERGAVQILGDVPTVVWSGEAIEVHVAGSADERAARQAHLQQAEADFETIAFDGDAARVFGTVAASLRASGRKPAARAYDALIAASAIAHGLPLFTCNPHDFEAIPQLDVRSVPHSDRGEK